MRKATSLLLTAILACSLCACSGKPAQQQTASVAENAPVQQETATASEQVADSRAEDDVKVLFGYRYAFPTETTTATKAAGALVQASACDLFLYGTDYLEFSAWEDVVVRCKDDFANSIDGALGWRATAVSAATEIPTTNQYGVEMMRVTGELSGSDGTKSYIAYYYLTDENYVRFMIATNFENEADAAEVIDYVAEHLEATK